MSKQKIYRVVGHSVWMLVLAGVVFLFLTAMQSRQQTVCTGVLVKINSPDGKLFIDNKEITAILTQEMKGNVQQKLQAIDLRKMETRLRKEVWIEDAQLFVDNDGMLHARIIERVPVARIFDIQGSSYYIDSTGKNLPLSNTDRADIPVFTSMPVLNKNNAAVYNKAIAGVINISKALESDPFWKAQAASVDVLPNGKFEMYPAIGFHTIDLGDTSQIKDKLYRLKAFYREILAKKSIAAYSRISVAFQHQVVAVKGTDSLRNIDAIKAMEVFNQLVDKNKTEVNALAVESEKEKGRIMQEPERNTKPQQSTVTPPAKTPVTLPAISNKDSITSKPKAILPPKTSLN
jgi:cell division protein FtsQ